MAKHAFHSGVHVATGVPVTSIANKALPITHTANGNHVTGAVVSLKGDITALAHSRQFVTTQVAFLLFLCIFKAARRNGSGGGRWRMCAFSSLTTAR